LVTKELAGPDPIRRLTTKEGKNLHFGPFLGDSPGKHPCVGFSAPHPKILGRKDQDSHHRRAKRKTCWGVFTRLGSGEAGLTSQITGIIMIDFSAILKLRQIRGANSAQPEDKDNECPKT
jgi:hypothetical protein